MDATLVTFAGVHGLPKLSAPVGTEAVDPVAMAFGCRLWTRRLAQAIHLTGLSLPAWPNL